MNYLKQRRSLIILASFLAFFALVVAVPGIDLYVSGLFYQDTGFVRDQWWQKLLQDCLGWFLGISVLAVLGMYACNRWLKKTICRVDGKRVVYLLLVAIVGAGLIVNVAFKNHVGRARPRQVVEFGGDRQFTPPFVISDQCRRNCSFSSGDSAAAFFSIALAMTLSRRRRYQVAAVAFGTVVSYARVSSGAHFLSDAVTSFFVMWLLADVLYYYLVRVPEARQPVPLGAVAETAA